MTELLTGTQVSETVVLRPDQARLRSQLYGNEFVENEQIDETGNYHLQLKMPKTEFTKLMGQAGIQMNGFEELTEEAEELTNPKVNNTAEDTELAEVSSAKYCVN